MVQGRKPKATKLKVVQGNPGKRKINSDEPEYKALDLSEPPEDLSGLARQMWLEYAPQLQASKVLTIVDAHNLKAFCVNYALWEEAAMQIFAAGDDEEDPEEAALIKKNKFVAFTADGGVKKNPVISAMSEFQKNWERLGSLMGLDPSSRTRLAVPGTKGKDNPFGKRRRKA